MGRYPKSARAASVKCIACNAPVARTVDDRYVCVECGEMPIESRSGDGPGLASTADESTGSARPTATDD